MPNEYATPTKEAMWFCDTSEPSITDVSPSHYQISATSAPPSVPLQSIKQIKKTVTEIETRKTE